METTMRIAEVASRSGFPAATLRYYEGRALLPPPRRTPAGYRAYDEAVLDRLAFIARAKAVGCSLDEIVELMADWDQGRCAPLQERLRRQTTAKLGDAQTRIAELTAFAADLRRALGTLASHTPEGPCDQDCGCISETSLSSAPSVACTLSSDELPGRLQQWGQLLSHVSGRVEIDGGVRLTLDATTPMGELARLVRAEQTCCAFFAFAITVDDRGVGLEIRAPAEALSAIDSLLGPLPADA